MNYIQVLTITCTSCGKEVSGYYSKGDEWWNEFVENGEEICLSCIKKRPGFIEAFEKEVGFKIDQFNDDGRYVG